MWALAVARHYPQHQFLFVSHSHGAELLKREYPVIECYNPETPVVAHRVHAPGAVLSTLRTWGRQPRLTRMLLREIERFQPDVAITDYEYFVPRAARAVGLPCLSLDNQHAITMGRIAFPFTQAPSWMATALAVRQLFSCANQYVISCFFEVSPRKVEPWIRWTPAILRDAVINLPSRSGEHVLAYQGYSTFDGFTESLRRLERPVHVYGMGGNRREGRVVFKESNEQAFLEDLATCAFVVCGGGRTLISEALHLGKPVFSIPVQNAFEQFMNAFYVERCGYGMRSNIAGFSIRQLLHFEKQLDVYRNQIRQRRFCGNDEVFAALDDFIAGRWRRGGCGPGPTIGTDHRKPAQSVPR
jgi:uncharacterized protein (TIGR00661 family)